MPCNTHIERGQDWTIGPQGNTITISYALTDSEFAIPSDRIAVIGEFTNEEGPACPDYFLVIVCSQNDWYRIPMNAKGMEETLAWFRERLGPMGERTLYSCARLNSRVLWPFEIVGAPIFRFVNIRRTIWDRIMRWWGLGICESQVLESTLESAARSLTRQAGTTPNGA